MKSNLARNGSKKVPRMPLVIALHLAFLVSAAWPFLTACSSTGLDHSPSVEAVSFFGKVHGGQQVLGGAEIQLYAASSTGDGAAAISLLPQSVKTGTDGNFSITEMYSCPSSSAPVYVVAMNGSSVSGASSQSTVSALMAPVGICGNIHSAAQIDVNEVSTVASVWSLAPFMSSYRDAGASPDHSQLLLNAFTGISGLMNTSTGVMPKLTLASGATVTPSDLAIASGAVANCVDTNGASAGEGTTCGNLFSLAQQPGKPAPANTIDALLNIAKSATFEISELNLLGSSPAPTPTPTPKPTPTRITGTFTLSGLISPATVTESIFVASRGLASAVTVSYFIDDKLVATETASPYWMGGQTSGSPKGFSVTSLGVGAHSLRATALLADGSGMTSNIISLNVVPSINSQLSSSLSTYANQPTAQQLSVASVLSSTATSGAALTSAEVGARQAVLAMYLNWGIDPSLDNANDSSGILHSLAPKTWQPPTSKVLATPFSMAFSPDAVYYHAIPALWPRVALPSGYIKKLQVNSAYGGDGIGFGETIAASTDPQLVVTSQWYSDISTLKTFPFRMKSTWISSLPTLKAGDSHVIFVDPATNSFISSYKTTLNTKTNGPNALYASSPTSFDSLGDSGGSNAAGFAELPVMVQPGEATDPTHPIQHAIGGPVARTWAARVYPATAWDAGIMKSTNSCTGVGYTNTGLVPYGGVIQLDPQLDLSKLSLSLPALRILQAMQTYGYYVMDFGCTDMDIYTAISESELEPYGGLYGNAKGPGVQNEVQEVLTSNKLYVVAPLIKKQ